MNLISAMRSLETYSQILTMMFYTRWSVHIIPKQKFNKSDMPEIIEDIPTYPEDEVCSDHCDLDQYDHHYDEN